MDRKSLIGIVLIFAVFLIFSYLNQPSKQEIEAARHRRDSTEQARVEKEKSALENKTNNAQALAGTNGPDSVSTNVADKMNNLYGDFGAAALGEEEFVTLENNLMKVVVSTKGGRIYSVELKNFKRFDASDLVLIEGEKSLLNLEFFAQNRSIKTDQLYFKPNTSSKSITVNGPAVSKANFGRAKFNEKNKGESKELVMRLEAANGGYIDYVYTIKYNSYAIDFDVRINGLQNTIKTNTGFVNLNFAFDVPRQEKTSTYGEDRYTSIYYKFKDDDDVDHLNLTKSESKNLTTPVKWIGYKQLFFSSVLVADESFANATVSTEKFKPTSKYISHFKSSIGLPFDERASQSFAMSFYFGPNHYQTLKEQGLEMEKLITLGWPIVREVNRYLIIPVFNFLNRRIASYGLIILILTIIIRIIVTPFTYKTYVSQAKMKALKPEIDEINKKFPPEKAMERQQATMELYRKVGVNPMGGCLPMLFQMPILIAMFYFFPGSIELRQQGFLWATDLSTYDSILNLPFMIPMYGNHVSLFTLLMTITTILQTYLTSQMQDNSAMPGMKYMMYFMPIFFMLLLNSYSSGLSYYYLLTNIFSIAQTYIIRQTIDENKVRAQLQANKKKPEKKKSNFQKRMEEMAKQQQQQPVRRK